MDIQRVDKNIQDTLEEQGIHWLSQIPRSVGEARIFFSKLLGQLGIYVEKSWIFTSYFTIKVDFSGLR